MVDFKGSRDEAASKFEVLVRRKADHARRCDMPFDATPNLKQGLDRFDEISWSDDAARGVADEISLAQVIGDARGMIHVAVRQQHMIDRQDLRRRFADIEADVEFGARDNALFAGDAVADQAKVAENMFYEPGQFVLLSRQENFKTPAAEFTEFAGYNSQFRVVIEATRTREGECKASEKSYVEKRSFFLDILFIGS
jgi:hypothetical protein